MGVGGRVGGGEGGGGQERWILGIESRVGAGGGEGWGVSHRAL